MYYDSNKKQMFRFRLHSMPFMTGPSLILLSYCLPIIMGEPPTSQRLPNSSKCETFQRRKKRCGKHARAMACAYMKADRFYIPSMALKTMGTK